MQRIKSGLQRGIYVSMGLAVCALAGAVIRPVAAVAQDALSTTTFACTLLEITARDASKRHPAVAPVRTAELPWESIALSLSEDGTVVNGRKSYDFGAYEIDVNFSTAVDPTPDNPPQLHIYAFDKKTHNYVSASGFPYGGPPVRPNLLVDTNFSKRTNRHTTLTYYAACVAMTVR